MAQEKNFERRVKNWIKGRGGWYCKYHGDGYSKAGIPDLHACISGRFCEIEVKAL